MIRTAMSRGVANPSSGWLPLFIFSYGTELQNWPLAAALSIVLLVLVVAITYLFARTMNRLSRRGEWEMV